MNSTYEFFEGEEDNETVTTSDIQGTSGDNASSVPTSKKVLGDLFGPMTIPAGVIHTLDGKYYMEVDFIIKNPTMAAEIAKNYKLQNQPKRKIDPRELSETKEFHWTPELSRMFAIACTAFGIKKVTPKQLQSALPFEIGRESVGSHLQKYRLKLAKQHGLASTHDIQNSNIPTDLRDEKLSSLKQLWMQGDFQGFSVDEVKELLEHEHALK